MKRRDFCLALPGWLVLTASACTPSNPRPFRSPPEGPRRQGALQTAPAPPVPAPVPDRPQILPLFKHYPLLGKKLPYAPLGLLPTPIDNAADLGRHLGI